MERNEKSSSRDIIYAIRKIAGLDGLKKASFITATVNSVDEENRQCNATIVLGESDIEVTEIGLNTEPNDGFVLFPKVDTQILICLMPDNSAYMVLCNDIDKAICVIDQDNKYEFNSDGFIFNDGTNQGLIKIIEHTTKLNQLVTELQAQLVLIATGIAGAGGAYTPGTLSQFNKSDYENTKIKH